MTKTKACQIAKDRITIVSNGYKQYRVNRYDPKRNATWQGHVSMPWAQAVMAAKESKIAEALGLLGFDDEDDSAGYYAQRYVDITGSFENVVSYILAKHARTL